MTTPTTTTPANAAEPPTVQPSRRRPTLAHRAEFYALRGAVGLLSHMSWKRASDFGARLGRLGYRPLGIRREVVETQIRASFPDLDEAGVQRIARGAYESLGRTSIETAILPTLGREEVLGLFEGVDGWPVVEAAMAEGRGMIIVAGHLGNWEMAGAFLAARGVPLDAVTRGQGNPLFDAYITETRTKIGMHVVNDREAVRRTPRSLKQGRAVALVMDQGVAGLASTFVPFFGRMAKTPRGPAVFALRFGSPMVFLAPLRQPDGRFRISFERVPVNPTGDKERDIETIVAEYTRVLERWVRRVPEQYFWHHRRWKHQPPGGAAAPPRAEEA